MSIDINICTHRWADSPSDTGEGIYCTRCGDMENVKRLRGQVAELEKHRKNGVSAMPDPDEEISIDGITRPRIIWTNFVRVNEELAAYHQGKAGRIIQALEESK